VVEHAYKWPLEKAIDLSIKATSFAKTQGLYTVFFTIDGTRTDMDWLLKLVNPKQVFCTYSEIDRELAIENMSKYDADRI
jgi:isopropylmalate/homocitrate/citramalate synthase